MGVKGYSVDREVAEGPCIKFKLVLHGISRPAEICMQQLWDTASMNSCSRGETGLCNRRNLVAKAVGEPLR